MAWLQNLAGHAENLLNKIDQNAATVLNDPKVFNEDMGKEWTNEFNISHHEMSSASLSKLIPDPTTTEFFTFQNDKEDCGDTLFSNISEQQKPSIHDTSDENALEKSLHSSPSSASIHNSFLLNQEVDNLHTKIAQLESDNQNVNKEFLDMRHLFSEIRNENNNLRLQLERTIEELNMAQQEKEQYVARAQRILQEKEKMIALKETSSSSEAEQNILSNYTEELKKELEFQQTKVTELIEKNRVLTKEIESLQVQHQIAQKKLNQTIQHLEENILLEKRNRTLAEEDCSQKTKDLFTKANDIFQLQETIKLKNEEIGQLRIAISQKNDTNSSEEYENRIKSLTQTLMLKQHSLETVTTERNALRFQLEKIEAEHRREIAVLKKDQVKVINMQDIHEERITVPHFMRVSPHDRGVTRRVKQTYSTLDAISVRTGIFLRGYPVARVFVFTYIVILHMWVLLVLFWYAPSNR